MFFRAANLIEGGGGGYVVFSKNFFCRRFERNCGELLFRMSGTQA
jgi:hypothetical protein